MHPFELLVVEVPHDRGRTRGFWPRGVACARGLLHSGRTLDEYQYLYPCGVLCIRLFQYPKTRLLDALVELSVYEAFYIPGKHVAHPL